MKPVIVASHFGIKNDGPYEISQDGILRYGFDETRPWLSVVRKGMVAYGFEENRDLNRMYLERISNQIGAYLKNAKYPKPEYPNPSDGEKECAERVKNAIKDVLTQGIKMEYHRRQSAVRMEKIFCYDYEQAEKCFNYADAYESAKTTKQPHRNKSIYSHGQKHTQRKYKKASCIYRYQDRKCSEKITYIMDHLKESDDYWDDYNDRWELYQRSIRPSYHQRRFFFASDPWRLVLESYPWKFDDFIKN